jgi:predicted DNA-binding transcriptional regulator AlpA
MAEVLLPWSIVKQRVHYGRTRVDALEREGRFPKRRKVMPGQGGRVAWLESELDEWIRSRPVGRAGPVEGQGRSGTALNRPRPLPSRPARPLNRENAA